jgi:predicted RNA binding protein YcfA (HicA-like mRNA interferase family)
MFFDLGILMSKNMKVSHILKLLRDDGWKLVRTKGSHRQFRHSEKRGLVTISGKPSEEIKKGTLASILKQAGLK